MDAFLLEAALPYALRATVVLALAALAGRVLRRRSAALRHRVWVLAIASLVLLPAFSGLLPTWRVLPIRAAARTPRPAPVGEAHTGAIPAALAGSRPIDARAPVTPVDSTPRIAQPDLARGATAVAALCALWAVGVFAVFVGLARDIAARTRLGRRALPLRDLPGDRAVHVAAHDAAAALGLRRAVELRWTDEIAVPATWGYCRPVIVLPAESRGAWTDDRRRAVMLHELAHVLRGDAPLQFAARAVLALHWFNPLAWRALAQLQIEAEHAADDRVLAAGFRPATYADHLLSVARSLRHRLAPPAAAVAMARPRPASALERRVRAILAAGRPRVALGHGASLASMAVAALVLLPLASAGCIRIGSQSSFTESSDSDAPVGYFAQPRFAGECRGGVLGIGTRRSVLVRTDDDGRSEITLKQAGCQLEIDLDGSVRLGEGGVEEIGDGGFFEAVETSGLGTREVRVARSAGAQPRFVYRVDGREQPFEGAGSEFLAAVVQEVYRSTEIGAADRVARLYAAGGLDGVLAEIEKITSGHVRQAYLAALISSGKLASDEIARAMESAGRLVKSDYELARMLEHAHEAWPKDRPLPAEFFRAVGTVESDYERSQLLQKVIRDRPPLEADRVAVLESIGAIESDYERSQTLKAVIDRQPPTSAELPAILAATDRLDSDYEHGQVLRRVIESRPLTDADVVALLASVRKIDSDYERAELLTEIAKRHQITGPVLDVYVAVAESLGSEHDQNRSMAAALRSRPKPATN